MPAVVFTVKAPTEPERRRAPYKLLHVVKGRSGKPCAYVGRGLPQSGAAPALVSSEALRPRFTVYADVDGKRPLCAVVRPVPGQGEAGALLVLGPDAQRLATVRSGPTRLGRVFGCDQSADLPSSRNLIR